MVLQWNHTRTGRPMSVTYKTFGMAWIRVAMVRAIFPGHPFTLNGQPI